MSRSDFEVRPGTPDHDLARDAFVRSHEHGSLFHLVAWERAVHSVFGNQQRDLLAFEGEELIGVLPLMYTPGFLGGKNLISVPYGVYGGPLGRDAEVEQALLTEATSIADREQIGHLELRYAWDPGSEMAGSSLYHTFIKDLPEKVEGVLAGMPKKARAAARKARKNHGLQLSEGVWYVEDLYRMFARNKHGLGSPSLPKKMFEAMVREFRGNVYIHMVRKGSEPLAAVMSFAYGDTLTAYYSGTEQDADRNYSASNFMYLALQEWAVERGFRVFDFGRSRVDSGAYKFKVHQGFEGRQLNYRYHLVRHRATPSFTPSNPKTQVMQSIWRQLPVWFVRRLSDVVSPYLP